MSTNRAALVLTSVQENYNRVGIQPQDFADVFVFSEIDIRDIVGEEAAIFYTDPIDVAFYTDCRVIGEMTGNTTVAGTITVTMQETPLSGDTVDADYWTTAVGGSTPATDTLDRTKGSDFIVLNGDLAKSRQIRFSVGATGVNNPDINISIKGILK
jgi:hypothetical protein